MAKKPSSPRGAKPKAKPGRKPELFKIEGTFEELIKRSLQVKKPAGGWPKPPKKTGKK